VKKAAAKLEQHVEVKEEPKEAEVHEEVKEVKDVKEVKEVSSAPTKSVLKKNGQYAAGKASPTSEASVGSKRSKPQTLEDLLEETETAIKLEKGEVEIHPIGNVIGFSGNLGAKRVQFNSQNNIHEYEVQTPEESESVSSNE